MRVSGKKFVYIIIDFFHFFPDALHSTVYLTGQYIGKSSDHIYYCLIDSNLLDQHFQDEEPFDSELDSDEEDAYDLRDVSSDVEMHPDDLDNVESDGE